MTEPIAPETDEEAPTCYRHAGREAWVRCNRCDRPICPDCMVEAAVGFQCPDCVREGNRGLRERRTVFGGRVGADGRVTRVLVGMNVAAFLLQLASARIADDFALVSLSVAGGDFHRLLTAAFLHANPLHIAFNMYALLIFGTVVEQALGRSRFVAVYLLSALGGSALSYLLHAPVGPGFVPFGGLGASGAVFGLFGAYFVIARRLRTDTSQILGLIVVNLVLGFAIPNIDNFAHIGGLAVGAGVTAVFAQVPAGPQRTQVHVVAGALVAVLLATLVALRTGDLRRDCPGVTSGNLAQAAFSCRTSGAAPPAR